CFMQFVEHHYARKLADYDALYNWSINCREDFWDAIWRFFKIPNETDGETDGYRVLEPADVMFKANWFSGAKLNFAQNLLRFRDEHIALEFHNEKGHSVSLSYGDLYTQVAQLSAALKISGIGKGDRVAAIMPNIVQTVVAMLASTSLGAVWSCCSPEFGLQAMLDRFQQIQPKLLIFTDGYYYKGKSYKRLAVIKQLMAELSSLQLKVLVPYLDKEDEFEEMQGDKVELFDDFKLSGCQDVALQNIVFEKTEFSHPLYILYSSGTTGTPKCIVHGVGGTLLQHLKELSLHTDIKRSDKLFFYTSTGWMMWNWLISGLSLGATLVLYDGSPFYPQAQSLLRLVDQQKITVFGCGAKYISTLHRQQTEINYALKDLRLILSTGSPLLAQSYDYVYQTIKSDVQLSSISGGTDIISCFALGNPLTPVYRGELQGPGLGMAVEVWNEQGEALIQQKGELVCTRSFPSMPIYFWNDPQHKKYHKAYFEKYSGLWAQGDYAELTAHQGLIIYGRSDATLNPAGIRIGTAEIYRQLENNASIVDSVVVGQRWKGDQRIILFVQLV
ncbi:Acetoacetyl-CoA synthetase, partial [hydrothermal vent metagenome]